MAIQGVHESGQQNAGGSVESGKKEVKALEINFNQAVQKITFLLFELQTKFCEEERKAKIMRYAIEHVLKTKQPDWEQVLRGSL